MKKILNIVGTLVIAMVIILLLGCNNISAEAAYKNTETIYVVEPADEATDTIIIEETEATEVILENVSEPVTDKNNCSYGDEFYRPDTVETIVNGAGKEIKLFYDSSLVWPESEEETLAMFLCHEGGTPEEKARIAQIIVMRKNDAEYPDTIREVLCQSGMFYINGTAWNEWLEPKEEDYTIAKAALASNELPEYSTYVYIEYLDDLKSYHPDIEFYTTEHFAFFN